MKWGIQRSMLLDRMAAMPIIGGQIGKHYDECLRLKYSLNYRLLRNPASRRAFDGSVVNLNAIQRRLVEDLLTTGLATCHFSDLFGNDHLWSSLCEEISQFTARRDIKAAIESRQEGFTQSRDLGKVEHYILFKYPQDRCPVITADEVLLRLHLNSMILDVANSYLGLWSKLIYFDMWYTVPLDTETRFLSQRWHRDPEDRRKIRTFLYFSTVSSSSGAMEYMKGSHVGGPYEHVFPWKDPLTTPYPPDGEVERLIPESQHVFLEGPPGTLIFCDTAGFHRGGISRAVPRILATSAFVTPASLHGRRYDIDDSVRASSLGPAARFAVS